MSNPSTVSGLLEQAASGTGVITVLGAEREEVSIGELWSRSEHAAACFLDGVGAGGAVALMLETSLDCLISVVGAWRAGITTLSLPHPPRLTPLETCREDLLAVLLTAGAKLVVLPDRFADLALGEAITTTSFRHCASHPRRADVTDSGEFVQFSSGSTGQPKGTRLTSAALVNNVRAILEHIEPHAERVVACSWLPLSHDMGLIGMCLTGLVAMGPPWRGRRLALMPPERMVARPSRWLQACSDLGATITAAPNFALDLVLAHPRALAGADLRPMRALMVGSELVSPATLRRFSEATGPLGFDSRALCPAYGLAEASVAVTMVRPGTGWHAASGGLDTTEVLSCGTPLRCLEVCAPAARDGAGPIAVRGGSLLHGYLGQSGSPLDAGGWLHTSDLGFLRDGELHVVGRADDVLVIAGRKLHPAPFEATASGHEAIRPGGCAAIPDGEGGYVIVAERHRAHKGSDLGEAGRWIRRELSIRCGFAPSAVLLIPPGSMPRTPSGKVRRKQLGLLRQRGELAVEADLRFGTAGTAGTA